MGLSRPHGNTATNRATLTGGNMVSGLTVGIVKANDDPSQMGRLKVYCPSIDSESFEIDSLPWATYVTPFGGASRDQVVGRYREKVDGITAYGFWAIPKIGSTVLVGFLDNNPSTRLWLGCIYPTTTISTIPGGRQFSESGKYGAFTEDNNQLEHIMRPLRNAGLDKGSYYKTRGGYERQISHGTTNNKDGKEGYGKNTTNSNFLDSMVYCLSTPGGHFVTMSDNPDHCRIRMRSTAGNQIILDDTNERIYVSTADGDTWIELDEDGHLHMYGGQSVSFSAGVDVNISAGNNINLAAGGQINIKGASGINIDTNGTLNLSSGGSTLISACEQLGLTGVNTVNITSQAAMNMKVAGNLTIKGAQLHIQGPDPDAAAVAAGANNPSVVPTHEPWKRPAGSKKRNSFWSE